LAADLRKQQQQLDAQCNPRPGDQHEMAPYRRAMNDRYLTLRVQLAALTPIVPISGAVLDPCGSDRDAVAENLPTLCSCAVRCNDSNSALPASSHMDATSAQFWDTAEQPDWVVGSPPYGNAVTIVQHALSTAKVGVAFKLRLTFLEPCLDRAPLLERSPPAGIIVLPRVTYRKQITGSSQDWACEAWIIWLAPDSGIRIPPISVVSRETFESLANLQSSTSI